MRRRARSCVVVVLFLLAWALPAWAQRTFYVQNGGPNNGCSQSITAPQNSLSSAVGCLTQPGDTLYMLTNGTNNTFTCSGEFCMVPPSAGSGEGARITIAGFDGTPNGGRRVVTVNGWLHPIDSGKAFITYKNFRLNATGQPFGAKIDGHSSSNHAHHIRIDDVEIFGADRHGIQIPGSQFGNGAAGGNEILNSEIHHNATEIQYDHGVYACSDDLVIENTTFHDNCGCGIHIYCTDASEPHVSRNIVRNNLVYNQTSHFDGENLGLGHVCGPNHDGSSASCGTGILVNTGDSHQIYNNRVRNSDGAYYIARGNTKIFNNSALNNNSCFRLDQSSDDVRNNICQNSGGCSGANCSTSASLDSSTLKLSGTIGGGQNLTSQNIPKLNADFEGTPRPASGAWDVGADQFGAAGCGGCPTACTSAGKTCTTDPCVCDDVSAGQQDPIAWWKFDEASGTTATDSGNPGGKNGTLSGNVTRTAGRVGTGAVTLDGTTGVVTLPDAIFSAFGAPHTVCMWTQVVNPPALGSGGFKQGFLNLLNPAGTDGMRSVVDEIAFNTAPAGTWHVVVLIGGGKRSRALTTVLAANTWTHLCHTYTSSTDTIALFVNGSPASSIAGDVFDPASANVLGARDTTGGGTLNGKLDEVKFWNRVLTATEITTEFNGAGSPPANKTPRHTKSLAAQ